MLIKTYLCIARTLSGCMRTELFCTANRTTLSAENSDVWRGEVLRAYQFRYSDDAHAFSQYVQRFTILLIAMTVVYRKSKSSQAVAR